MVGHVSVEGETPKRRVIRFRSPVSSVRVPHARAIASLVSSVLALPSSRPSSSSRSLHLPIADLDVTFANLSEGDVESERVAALAAPVGCEDCSATPSPATSRPALATNAKNGGVLWASLSQLAEHGAAQQHHGIAGDCAGREDWQRALGLLSEMADSTGQHSTITASLAIILEG